MRKILRVPLLALAALFVIILFAGVFYFGSWFLFASYDDFRPFVIQNIDQLGTEFSSVEVLLLEQHPKAAFSQDFISELVSELQHRDCRVLLATTENIKQYTNPDNTQWNHNRVIGARIAEVRIMGCLPSRNPKPWCTELWVGWNKGNLHGKGKVIGFYWNGFRWIKKYEGWYRN